MGKRSDQVHARRISRRGHRSRDLDRVRDDREEGDHLAKAGRAVQLDLLGRHVDQPRQERVPVAVELANAMLLSSAQGTTIHLPLDRQEYSEFMERMLGKELQAV